MKQTVDSLSGYRAYVAVNKAVVTQASSAIPVLPLYISILFKVMKEKNIHEDCAGQIHRLFKKFESGENLTDENGFIRLDDLEMRGDVQREVADRWERANDDNLGELADLAGYRSDFIKLFGFGIDGVDYGADTDPADIAVDENALCFVNLTE
jgi:enoyl-[acyl-carrier protein] reductase/trans-2-enoyl-CoA reductase (NAD+)